MVAGVTMRAASPRFSSSRRDAIVDATLCSGYRVDLASRLFHIIAGELRTVVERGYHTPGDEHAAFLWELLRIFSRRNRENPRFLFDAHQAINNAASSPLLNLQTRGFLQQNAPLIHELFSSSSSSLETSPRGTTLCSFDYAAAPPVARDPPHEPTFAAISIATAEAEAEAVAEAEQAARRTTHVGHREREYDPAELSRVAGQVVARINSNSTIAARSLHFDQGGYLA